MHIICITDSDYNRNEELKAIVNTIPGSSMIDFYTNNLDELNVIAKYRVLPVPTILAIHNSRVVARIVRPPDNEQMSDILCLLQSIFK